VAQTTGSSVLIFPQGTHTTAEPELAADPRVRFRAGVGHLAAALAAPVVPFGLAGPERVIPQTAEGFDGLAIGGVPVSVKRGPLAVAFGAPLQLGRGESAQAFAARLQDICYGLTREAERAISGGTGTAETPGSAARVA
jgi:1-acyl-sn-glycerol-3-phosphate acyltransferase